MGVPMLLSMSKPGSKPTSLNGKVCVLNPLPPILPPQVETAISLYSPNISIFFSPNPLPTYSYALPRSIFKEGPFGLHPLLQLPAVLRVPM